MGFPVAERNAFLDERISGTLYIALFTIAPDNEGIGGEEVDITTCPDYIRLPFGSWTVAALGSKENAIIARWPQTTSAWGTIVSAALYDSATLGNFVARGDNTLNLIINIGVVPRIAAGELEFSFNNLVD